VAEKIRRVSMRKTLFWLGWAILFALPVAFAAEIYMIDDLPHVQPWKWAILGASVLMIYLTRNRDTVLQHHVV
jgi:lipid-A-disaccharide synthase-like uncharacterized protein